MNNQILYLNIATTTPLKKMIKKLSKFSIVKIKSKFAPLVKFKFKYL